jgi:hypothetical protein
MEFGVGSPYVWLNNRFEIARNSNEIPYATLGTSKFTLTSFDSLRKFKASDLLIKDHRLVLD